MIGKRLSSILYVFVWVLIFLDLLCAVTSPFWMNKLTIEQLHIDPLITFVTTIEAGGPYVFLLSFVIYCGVILAGILYEISNLLSSISKGEPFTYKNAKSLKIASYFSFALVIAFIIKLLYSPTLLTLLCIGGILIFGIFLLVLSELFLSAAKIKEENELTI